MNKLILTTTFITVVEQNSFVEASKLLTVSPSTVSRRIKALEDMINLRLIDRNTRELELTQVGASYYTEMQKIINSLDAVEQHVIQDYSEPCGNLRILCPRHVAKDYIVPHLAEFIKLYPKINITLETGERIPNMEREHFDLVFGLSIDMPENMVRKLITMSRSVLCASPNYLKKHGTPKNLEDLKEHNYINHNIRIPKDCITMNNSQVFVKPILLVNDVSTMISCALNDMGIIKLIEYFVTDEISSGKLKIILNKHAEENKPIYLFYQDKKLLDQKIRKFVDFFTPYMSKKY